MTQYYITNDQATALENMARQHNESIDRFINVTLKEHFGSDKISCDQWFEAQRLIKEQDFWTKGHNILKVIRAFGVDCKINAQTEKLYCPDLGIY